MLAPAVLALVWKRSFDAEIVDRLLIPGSLLVSTFRGITSINTTDGATRWSYPLKEEELGARLAVTTDRVFATVDNGPLVALDLKSGKKLFTLTHSGPATPLASADGTLVYSPAPGKVSSVALERRKANWTTSLPDEEILTVGPIPLKEGYFVGGKKGFVGILSKKDGKPIWAGNMGGKVEGTVISAERVFAVTSNGYLVALSRSTGTAVWIGDVGNSVVGTPVLLDERVVLTSPGGFAISFGSELGPTLWRASLNRDQDYGISPALAQGDDVLIMQRNRMLRVGATGNVEEVARFDQTASRFAPARIGDDFVLFASHAAFRVRLKTATNGYNADSWRATTSFSPLGAPSRVLSAMLPERLGRR